MMSTALVRFCDTPAEVMKHWQALVKWVDFGLHTPQRHWFGFDLAKGEDESVAMMREGDRLVRVPILFSDGKHDDTDALDALYAGQWYYDVKRETLQRVTSERVFINGPHLISRPLTREQRRRTYTDHPAPFVMNAYPERIE